MNDTSCVLAGLIRLLTPPVLIVLWHKKTGARFYPALIAVIVCFPAFIIGAMIRSGFQIESFVGRFLANGLLYGILEEGTKFLTMKYLLGDYDSRKDAVTYGLAHGYQENFSAGLSCFGLIGTGRAASDIFGVNLWTALAGAAFSVSLTVLIFYGIQTDKSMLMLPIAILVHAFGNAFMGIFRFDTAVVILGDGLLTAGVCYAAYRCWKSLWDPYDDEYKTG